MPCQMSESERAGYEEEGRLQKHANQLALFWNRWIGKTKENVRHVWPLNKIDLNGQHDWQQVCDARTKELCRAIRNCSKRDRKRVLYGDPESQVCRDMATWWDEHKAADKARTQAKKRRKAKRRIARAGWAKLTERERWALGVSDKRP